jgi:hypothetical protein
VRSTIERRGEFLHTFRFEFVPLVAEECYVGCNSVKLLSDDLERLVESCMALLLAWTLGRGPCRLKGTVLLGGVSHETSRRSWTTRIGGLIKSALDRRHVSGLGCVTTRKRQIRNLATGATFPGVWPAAIEASNIGKSMRIEFCQNKWNQDEGETYVVNGA